MRVLWISEPPGLDYLAAFVFLGLVEELGADSVVEWPFQHAYRDLGALPFAWLGGRVAPAREWTASEVLGGGFDLVLASVRPSSIARLRQLIAARGRPAHFALLDGEDSTHLEWGLVQEFRPDVYFKTSLSTTEWVHHPRERVAMRDTTRVVCTPLCTTFGTVEPAPKTIDVCFLGGNHWNGPRREATAEDRPRLKPILEHELRAKLRGFRLVTGNLPHGEFKVSVAESRIFVSPGGFGLEAVRTYEAMSCPDTLVIREDIAQHLTPWPFVHRATCLTFRQHDEVPELCRIWLAREEERLAIARRGTELIQAHYTPRARARQILEESFR